MKAIEAINYKVSLGFVESQLLVDELGSKAKQPTFQHILVIHVVTRKNKDSEYSHSRSTEANNGQRGKGIKDTEAPRGREGKL